MRRSKSFYLLLITFILAAYYLVCGIYLNKLGYTNSESLFYLEKAKIVFDGVGDRIKVIGFTSPIFPFYATFIFTTISGLSPLIASAIGTALLFYIMAKSLTKRFNDDYYLLILVLLFLFHPGLLYTACSGKGIYLILIFFYLFFLNILKFYRSNTTFHISIASICLVILVFCDYKFIWLTLFFIPLVLSITIQSLNLSEKESIFRMFLSFNSPSLRRKLISKTFALYVIMFILPIASIFCYKLLNLSHANDLNYFTENPYATWNVLNDKLNHNLLQSTGENSSYLPQEVSLLISVKALIFCPLILIAIYLFSESTYQILTLITPFAFIEFLHIKYDTVYLAYEYYLIFLILALLCVLYKAQLVKNQKALKIIIAIMVIVQVYTGYLFLSRSSITEEHNFITMLTTVIPDESQNNNQEITSYINHLPTDYKILMDDAVAYPIAAYANNIKQLTMPYQDEFASAIESPQKYDDYILVATPRNLSTSYTQLNDSYITIIQQNDKNLKLHVVYENDDWVLYHIGVTKQKR